MRLRVMTLAIFALLCGGCANIESNRFFRVKADPAKLREKSTKELYYIYDCTPQYDHYKINSDLEMTKQARGAITTVLKERGLSQKELEYALQNKLFIGMSEYGLLASWSKPADINRTTGSWGVQKQFVYGYFPGNRRYVYTENGKVTSWQD